MEKRAGGSHVANIRAATIKQPTNQQIIMTSSIMICIWSNNWIFEILVTRLQASRGRCLSAWNQRCSHMIKQNSCLKNRILSPLFINASRRSEDITRLKKVTLIRKVLLGSVQGWWQPCWIVSWLSPCGLSLWKGKWRASVVRVTRLQSGTKPRNFFPS